MFQVTRSY